MDHPNPYLASLVLSLVAGFAVFGLGLCLTLALRGGESAMSEGSRKSLLAALAATLVAWPAIFLLHSSQAAEDAKAARMLSETKEPFELLESWPGRAGAASGHNYHFLFKRLSDGSQARMSFSTHTLCKAYGRLKRGDVVQATVRVWEMPSGAVRLSFPYAEGEVCQD